MYRSRSIGCTNGDRTHHRPDARDRLQAALAFPLVATDLDLELTPLEGESRTLGDFMTTFPLVPVVLDPYTNESAWILDTAHRVLSHFRGAGCRPCWIVTCALDDAKEYLGPYADEFLSFADPSRSAVRALGVEQAPALLLVRQDGEVTAKAEGWNSDDWREVTEAIAELSHWSRPAMPAPGDPGTYSGTPISV